MARTPKARKPADSEPPASDPNHNGSDEATFLRHVRAILTATEMVDTAKATLKSIRKLAKADGIELKKLDAIVTMVEWEPGEIRDHFSTLNRYALWMGLPVGTQADLFAGVPQAARESVDWEARGLAAALTNKGAFAGEPPAECPPDCIQSWERGVRKGTEKIAWAMVEAGANPERTKTHTAASRPPLEPEPEPDADEAANRAHFAPTEAEGAFA